MRAKQRTLLSLEQLEERRTPATVQFVAGTLNVSPSPGEPALTLLLQQTKANTFQVTDNGKNDGTYGPVSNVNVTGGPGADSITFDVDGLTYTGNLTINTGNGPSGITFDTVNITNSSGTAGRIGGNVSILTGTGTPLVNVGVAGQLSIGGSVQISNPLAGGTLLTGNSGAITQFGGNLNVSGFSNVELGDGEADTVGGSLTITNPNTTVPVFVQIGDNMIVNKNLSISEGNGADSIAIGQITVNGSTNVNVGSGADLIGVGIETSLGGTSATFNGPVSVTAGSGNDLVATGPFVTINGNVTVNVGSGTDSIQLSPNPAVLGSSVSIFGNVNVTAGSGSDSVLVDAALSGNLSMNLGNGNDTVSVTTAPSGTFYLNAGNGASSVTLGTPAANSGSWFINFNFGTGSNSLTLGDGTAASTGTISGFLNSQANPLANTFNQGGWTIVPPWYQNF